MATDTKPGDLSGDLELKQLRAERGSIKGRVTKFKTYLDNLLTLTTVSSIELSKLSMKLSRMEALFSAFDELQSRIEQHFDENNLSSELNIRDIIEHEFDNCIASAQNIIQTHSPPSKQETRFNSECSHSNLNCSHYNKVSEFRLPVINVPKFNGTSSKWLQFKVTYLSLIHDNSKIENVHKFHYLNSYLEGEAADAISNLEFNEENYSVAWSILCNRFDNTKELINNHLTSLFQFEPFRATDKYLKSMIDQVTKNLRALRTLGLPTDQWDVLLIHVLSAKLDSSTNYKWEEHLNSLSSDVPTLEEFFSFLKNRINVISKVSNQRSINNDRTNNKLLPTTNKVHFKSLIVNSEENTSTNFRCTVCSGSHRVFDCTSFKSKTPEQRYSIIKSLNLCHNCLRRGHSTQACKLPGTCRICKKKHNTLIHMSSTTNDNATSAVVMSAFSNQKVLLCTAKVLLSNPNSNQVMTVRAILDSGSQTSFISQRVKRELGLTTQPSHIDLETIGNNKLHTNLERCSLDLHSNTSNFKVTMFCLVLNTITSNTPTTVLDVSLFNLNGYELADPTFYEPAAVDMLIGADLFWDLLDNKQQSLGPNNLNLQSSKLGWLIAGRIPNYIISKPNKSVSCNLLLNCESEQQNLDHQLSSFWDLENVPHAKPYTAEEKACEKHYISTTQRDSDGRFIVALPLKDEPDCLGESYFIAKKRFFNLESRFKKNPELKRLYSQFILEYAQMGHLSESLVQRPKNSYFLCHHPVFKETSESTKLRVVFQGNQRTTSGLSVNDLQLIGPTVQDSLFNILLRFRQHRYVLSGDIQKMYRCVTLRESDRNLQLILWRDNENERLRTLRLNTVTYGLASSSFLSTRSIWQVGEEVSDPLIKTIIQSDMYCDDLLTGCDSIEKLRHIQRSVSSELAKGCFPLRKYRSNIIDILFPDELNQCKETMNNNLLISNSTSTLGIGWVPSTDKIHFPFKYSSDLKLTKRSILSTTFKIFDPLGLLSLCTIKLKILLQRLWAEKVDWDDPVPTVISNTWKKFACNINELSSLTLPRLVLIPNFIKVELHCFTDSSQLALGSTIYLRSIDSDNNVSINLLCAKTRVAPNKPCSIPRLELCAALLGAELSGAVIKALRLDIDKTYYWTDSQIVLAWLKSPNKTKTFVANRVAAILDITSISDWRYVPTSDNPADLASRGVDPQHIKDAVLWWSGPTYLKQPETNWPLNSTYDDVVLPELKAFPVLITKPQTNSLSYDFQRFSKLHKLQRCYAMVLRFVHNCKNSKNKLTGPLSVNELNDARLTLVKIAQGDSYFLEIKLLSSKRTLNKKSNLCSLNPFVDSSGLLRVGGRLNKSGYPYEKKHPLLLDSKHCLTKLIFRAEHSRLLHAGPQHLLSSIREQYWPMGGRKLARDVARNCLVCSRFKGNTMINIMGDLPAERVQPDYPFSTVGTDFAGPFLITDRKGRGCKITKCYLCLFVCFRYKCLHLELVSELSKDAFLLTLKRFISRRGMPRIIYCDNGRNYVAAAKEIGHLLNTSRNSLLDFATSQGIEFKFSPPYAPNHNGLSEAGVKLAKFHLHRIIGQSHLTFEELTSVFAQIEAILNSRPLCPLSSLPNDFQALTPAHFLIGRSLTTLPPADYEEDDKPLVNRFHRIEQAKYHFWKRWSKEYVAELQQRTKWRFKMPPIELNDLVFIKDDAPPLQWRLGRVSRLFPGVDGVPRVVDVATPHGTVRRALNRICPLPGPNVDD